MHTIFKICVQKVGDSLNKIETAQKIIKRQGGIAKTADFLLSGMTNYDVAELCNKGYIERIRHGFYQLPKSGGIITDEQLIARLLPQGIVCVESALFYYGYSDFTPREWSIAVPRTASRRVSRLQEIPLKAYYIQKEFLDLGKITASFNGVTLSIYDRERTLCDCFKYRTRLDNELFNKAVNAYTADDKKNLVNLSKYAKKMRLYTKMMNVMEVLLNG